MKVPSPITGNTRTPQVRQAYIQGASNPGAGLAAAARGLNQLGNAVTQLEATFRQRDEQTERFNTLKGFSEFQTYTAEALTELKRNYSADGKGFANAANELYREKENEWLSKVSPELQDEFRYRSQEVRRGVIGDALTFQYQAGDAWFKQGVADELNKSKTILDQTPGALEAEQQRIFEVIASTDLPLAVKQDLQRQATISLASVTYKAEVRNDSSTAGALGIGEPSGVVDRIIGIESGGNPNAKNPNSSAEGLGQFIDSTWLDVLKRNRPDLASGKSDQELIALKRDPALSREMVAALVQENSDRLTRAGVTPTNANVYLAHFLGAGGAIAVARAAPDTPVSQILGQGQISANKSILEGKTAGDVRAWASRKMGNAKLATDPRFEVIPYEDRLALQADAERDVVRERAAQAQAAKVEQDAQQNALYLGLLDGRLGQVDIDNARASGLLDDYDSVSKALKILKDRDGETSLAMEGYTKLSSNGVFDPTDTEDKKRLNAMVKVGRGQDRLASGDASYVSDELVPLANRVGDIPTDVAGTLMGMVRGSDNQRMMFALDALAQLRDASDIAFNQRVSSDVAQQVDLWDALKAAVPKEELLATIRGGTTQAERQQREVLRKEAQSILTRVENGVVKGQALLDNAIGEFGGTFWSAQTAAPLAKQALSKEFNTLWVDAYSKTGNEEKASELALKQLQRTWGVTFFGGGKDLMKYPPEKVGYKAYEGSYNWINEQARKDLALKPEEDFDLFSDEQTRQEFQAFQRNASAPPPSYRVFIKDENGVYRERTDENGLPLRIKFIPDQVMKDREAELFDLQERKFLAEETISNYYKLTQAAGGLPIPPEDVEAYKKAVKELEEINEEHRRRISETWDADVRKNMSDGGLF